MVRNALKKHRPDFRGLDPCSSAVWFGGWKGSVARAWVRSPVAAAQTWLAAIGWQRLGLLAVDEAPSARVARGPGADRRPRTSRAVWTERLGH